MSCITTSSISILVNGKPTPYIQPSRGIRQGDPLSPYLFIICMETLSQLIEEETQLKKWTPIKIARVGPYLSHLLFADVLVLFAKVDITDAHSIINIFNHLSTQSGQCINLAKSKLFFSKHVSQNTKNNLASNLNIKTASIFGKYLGFPKPNLHPTSVDYQYILDLMNNRLQGWKTKFLSLSGRTMLIKSVLYSIPTHVMQNNLLPPKIIQNMDRIQRRFLWGSKPTRKKLHLISWDVVTTPKKNGGLGLQKSYAKNIAMLASLNWSFLKQPQGNTALCHTATSWNIGQGNTIRLWYDNWISPNLSLHQLIHSPLTYNETSLTLDHIISPTSYNLSTFHFNSQYTFNYLSPIPTFQT